MIPFEMNADNFESYLGGGAADGTRVVADGIELNLTEHAPDADCLAVYHLHNGVLTDSSGNGHDLTAYNGPTLGDDGVEFSRADSQYAFDGAAVTLQGRGAITIEGWFRFDSVPAVGSGQGQSLFSQYGNVQLALIDTGSALVLRAHVNEQKTPSGYHAQIADYSWTPETGAWYHIALSWQQGGAVHLWVNGSNVASDTSLSGNDLLTTNADFTLATGNHRTPNKFFDGAIDEFRVSTCVRYATDFQPLRHLAIGTFTSPVFDSERLGCTWAQLAWSATMPGDAALAMEIAIGDELDGIGGIISAWLGTELVDVSGRYFQWRATPTPTTEGLNLASPIVQSVTAAASEAGANLYHGTGDEASVIDYATPIAQLGPGVTSHDVDGLDAACTHWFGLRSINAEGVVSLTVDAEVPLELDTEGDRVAARPASVESLEASGAGGGKILLRWLALAEMGDVAPDMFRIYSNGGSGDIDFDSAIGDVAVTADRRWWQWTTAAQADGATVTFAVRAETLAGGADAGPPEVTVVIDATAPLPVGQLEAAPVLND
jgi:Concanavalin A-like lectin/glucanases superfamily